MRHVLCDMFARFAGHFFLDAPQPTYEAPNVVVAIAVIPDLLNDLSHGLTVGLRRVRGHGSRVLEIGEQSSVEAVEDDEVRLVGIAIALAGTASEHLLE